MGAGRNELKLFPNEGDPTLVTVEQADPYAAEVAYWINCIRTGSKATRATPADARSAHARVRAFSAADLNRALERAIDRIVADWPDGRPPARRALRHELIERVRPYSTALRHLEEVTAAVLGADETSQLSAWRVWTRQLISVFEAADRTWLAIRPVVDALPKRESGRG